MILAKARRFARWTQRMIRADRGSEAFAAAAFRQLLGREPTPAEVAHWSRLTVALGPGEVMRMICGSDEYATRRGVETEVPAGHYYSPVVDTAALRAAGFSVDRSVPETSIPGIDFRPGEMVAFWRRNLPAMRSARFPAHETPGRRYYAENDAYAWGDAHVLLAMFNELRPRRVVEVGSGFSSACMLDICDDLGLATEFTFVEPYPDRLLARLTAADRDRVRIIPEPVQSLDPSIYEPLEAGDILFIDSTHVSKAGSDVNFELFQMLPALKPGVVIHFHDTFYPFEYPEEWIFQAKRSWNELYMLRAYLMENPLYEIVFFNDYFARKHRAEAAEAPLFQLNPGGGLWLRKRAPQPSARRGGP